MNLIRSILGSMLFAIGVSGFIWFLRNLLRRRINQARMYRGMNKYIVILICLVFLIGGWYLYSSLSIFPLVGFAIGLILGIVISR